MAIDPRAHEVVTSGGTCYPFNKERIESLLRDAVREGRLLDYKEMQPAPKQKPDNTDFLVDVSANGAGGLLVYGVAEARDANNMQT